MNKKKLKILLVEDSPEDQLTFQRYLRQDQNHIYHFLTSETGDEALEICLAEEPDCILLDYNLPDMTGLEFLAELIEAAGSMRFPVVMLTGSGTEMVAVQAMQSGVQDYLVKDKVKPISLVQALHSAMEKVEIKRKLEEHRLALEAKNKELEAFASTVAHDLQVPLRGIREYAQNLQDRYSPMMGHEDQAQLNYMVSASNRMSRLIEALLAYSRLGRQSVEYRPIPLNDILIQVCDDLGARIAATEAELIIPPDLPTVYGNATLLNQVFTNLLNNALTYHQPNIPPRIEIKATPRDRFAIIQVIDNGIGIPRQAREEIFNIFHRLHSSDRYPGTGIGLATVKKSVELMGGEVWVESAPNQGSRFYLKLLTQPEKEPSAVPAHQP